ncbi:c-type cytochrome biogenesis protein CcmI [Yoonia sp.]|uniref:c-type cytochrome biogenesis protein CcmI n=1 Tax=Yoonia sp. TaxID=2212373 RepID=UPI0019FB777D|nr:c-type cytochrome biogenesis protein CcmI [Yoonia sp.]MBE0414816.1 c-type cytochrome biogenesis protein CcmI [Yoonia sp.]
MIFWLICLVLALAVAAIVVMPLLRPAPVTDKSPDVALYRGQLDELDRDVERGVLAPDEAERARAEVARRLLAANKTKQRPLVASHPRRAVSIVVVIAVLGFAFGVYKTLGVPGYGDLPIKARLAASDEIRAARPGQEALEAAAPDMPPVDAPEDYLTAIAQLRTIAPTRADDLQAWELLAYHEAELRNYGAAARAQARVIDLKGAATDIEDMRRLLDMMVTAAGGFVSPEAEQVIRRILDRDADNYAARYYLGALYNQTDRPDIAYRLWREIAENGDPEVFHVAAARDQIEDAAFRAGIEYTLPTLRGPSAADIDNAQDMTPEERQAMIGNMVAGLADRLANEGGTASDWARLITAYGVMGDTDAARAVWVEAREVFGTSAAAMQVLTQAAQSAGALE